MLLPVNQFKGVDRMNEEASHVDYERKFADMVAEAVCNALRITSYDRRIVKALLRENLDPLFERRGQLLEQYLDSKLEVLADTFRNEFNLDKSIKVNNDYAMHAKFNDIIKAIKRKYGMEDK